MGKSASSSGLTVWIAPVDRWMCPSFKQLVHAGVRGTDHRVGLAGSAGMGRSGSPDCAAEVFHRALEQSNLSAAGTGFQGPSLRSSPLPRGSGACRGPPAIPSYRPTDQIVDHYRSQTVDIGGVQADGGLVQHIQHSGGTVAHRPGQLRSRWRSPVERVEAARSRVRYPSPSSISRRAAVRKESQLCSPPSRGRISSGREPGTPLHPGISQVGQGHFAEASSRPMPRSLGGPGLLHESRVPPQSGQMSCSEELLHPLHALFVLDFGEGIFHRIHCIVSR